MDNKSYLAFVLAISDQITDLQKNGKTYENSDIYKKAYFNILTLLNKFKENPYLKLIPYNGQWYTKEEIDKMFYRNIF